MAALRSLRKPPEQRIEIDAALSWTDREKLFKADFDDVGCRMGGGADADEDRHPVRAARDTPACASYIRAHRPAAMLRDSARRGGEFARLAYRRRLRPQPLVVLVDISGSMSRYSRMFLHFLHAITAGPNAADHRVSRSMFSTRLAHCRASGLRAIPMPRWRRSSTRSKTGRAVRASRRRCTSSTCAGRVACWAATRPCC
jgi:uncharacterized protein with von Willebrand factor type A (vWA) domain